MWWGAPFPASQLTKCTSDLAGQEGRYPFVPVRADTDVDLFGHVSTPPSLSGLLLLSGEHLVGKYLTFMRRKTAHHPPIFSPRHATAVP